MSIELYPSIAKIKRNGVYENLPGFVPETGAVATQQMIATSESSATAQYVHNKGEYFRLNDTLYQAIVKINVGDSIVVGTNCEVAVIGNDLTHVANSIAAYELGIATSSHNTGDYFMVGETLYVATADIQAGDNISTSTNCRVAVVGDELSELKTAITGYVQDNAVVWKPVLLDTLVDAQVDAVNRIIKNTSKCRTVVFDIFCAPKIICNYTGNRFVSMFVDTPTPTIGTTASSKSLTHNPGNNPTISDYVLENPSRARYLTIWYATSVKDFNGTLTLVNDVLSTVVDNAEIANFKDTQVKFRTPYGVDVPYNNLTTNAVYGVFGNNVKINGTISQPIFRIALYGDIIYSSGSAPTYPEAARAYFEPVSDFVIGHEYAIKINKISGSYTTTSTYTPYIDFRDSAGHSALNGNGSQALNIIHKWKCTFAPEAIFMGIREGTYNDAVFQYSIVDLTLLPNTDIVTNYLQGEIGDYIVPTYFETQLSTAISKINTDINSNKTEGTYGTDIESFIFITDVHWNNNKRHSPALIKKIMESCPIRTVICGGDFIENSTTKIKAVEEVKSFTDSIVNIPCYEYFAVCGNHDANGIDSNPVSEQFTKEEEFNLLYAPFTDKANVHWIWEDMPTVFGDTKVKNDYYVDHPRTKTRFLCIDWSHPWGTFRPAWVESVLSKNDGYRVIVIYHGIYSGGSSELTPEHTDIMTVLQPYKAKIVALFTGHAHVDDVVDYYGDGSVPVILTSCDKYSESAGAVADTVDEQCFDVAVIDYGQSKIELTRIGRGSDRTVNISVS